MAKFLDKKEQVIDFKLTPYGKQRLSVGKLKPIYYAFFDDGILYDSSYASFSEDQNDIHRRIKQETQFIEGILRFEEIETSEPPPTYLEPTIEDTEILRSDIDISPIKTTLKTDKYSFDSAIGSAAFEGENTQAAPAWKIVTCQGEIVSSAPRDTEHYNLTSASADSEATEFNIPQINVTLRYTKLAGPPEVARDPDGVEDFISQTPPFVDGNTIKLIKNDLVIYAEEQNTQIFTENFDIEVFEMLSSSAGDTSVTTLKRKFFERQAEQIVDGVMQSESPEVRYSTLTEDAVEYYFDILTDNQVDATIACQCASSFNRSSYYIDIDYDCDAKEKELIFYDIYGSVTVPEVCIPTPISDDEDCEDNE